MASQRFKMRLWAVSKLSFCLCLTRVRSLVPPLDLVTLATVLDPSLTRSHTFSHVMTPPSLFPFPPSHFTIS